MQPVLIVGLSLLAILMGYWLLILTEGTYLGSRIVALLYDWTAKRYDAIKALSFVDEARLLGVPLAARLERGGATRVLDVATGTGRLALAILRGAGYDGLVWGIDRSERMLRQAYSATTEYRDRLGLSRQDASTLAFADATFDVVTCLEALEFMPAPERVLGEMFRVLKPGGILLVSNRVGRDAWYFPGRLAGRGRLERVLRARQWRQVVTQPWQVHYDLIWAQKPDTEA